MAKFLVAPELSTNENGSSEEHAVALKEGRSLVSRKTF